MTPQGDGGKPQPSTAPSWLFVLPWLPTAVGGVNQVVLSLAAEMRRSGSFRPLVLVLDWRAPQPIFKAAEEIGVPTVHWRVRALPGAAGLRERLAYRFWERAFRHKFEAFCASHKVAVINPHYPGSTSLTLQRVAETFQRRVPVLFSFHGTDIVTIEKSPIEVTQWRQALLRPEQAIVACAQALADRLQETFKRSSAVVHNGVDMDALLRNAGPKQTSARRTILTVGKFEAVKSQDTLIQAFAQIHARFINVDLKLIGATDTALPALKALTAQLQITDRVSFITDVPHQQIAAHFANADVFVLPSRREQLPLVILEAAAFGLPVLASRVGGIPEIIHDGDTGRLVEPGQIQELADGMAALLSDPEAAQAMGARLLADTRERFSWQKAIQDYATLASAISRQTDQNTAA